MKRWAVADMDDGILRWERTRRDALEWARLMLGAARVVDAHSYGPGIYEYELGDARESDSIFVVRADRLAAAGYDPAQKPLYPHPDDPFERVDRVATG